MNIQRLSGSLPFPSAPRAEDVRGAEDASPRRRHGDFRRWERFEEEFRNMDPGRRGVIWVRPTPGEQMHFLDLFSDKEREEFVANNSEPYAKFHDTLSASDVDVWA